MNLSPLIVALDFDNRQKIKNLVEDLSKYVDIFKVGHLLYLKYGTEILDFLKEKRKKVFLDLKLHDIPNTVRLAVKAAKEREIFMLTLHALGGSEMIKEAKKEADDLPKLIAVTILTSLSERDIKSVGIKEKIEDLVKKLAKMAINSGAYGVVCSPQEAKAIRDILGSDKIIITPGVRLDENAQDQKRVATPKQAFESGADFIVVGRPIYQAPDPVGKVLQILKCIE